RLLVGAAHLLTCSRVGRDDRPLHPSSTGQPVQRLWPASGSRLPQPPVATSSTCPPVSSPKECGAAPVQSGGGDSTTTGTSCTCSTTASAGTTQSVVP